MAGGNDQIVGRLAAALPGQIVRHSVLTAVRRRDDGCFEVRIVPGGRDAGAGRGVGGGTSETVVADQLLLAIPFSVLRGVDPTPVDVIEDLKARLGERGSSREP